MFLTFLKTKLKEAFPFLLFPIPAAMLRKTKFTIGSTLGRAPPPALTPDGPGLALPLSSAAFSPPAAFPELLGEFWLLLLLLLGTLRRTMLTVCTRPSCWICACCKMAGNS